MGILFHWNFDKAIVNNQEVFTTGNVFIAAEGSVYNIILTV